MLLHLSILIAIPYGFALLAWTLLQVRSRRMVFLPDVLIVLSIVLTALLARGDSPPLRGIVVISGLLILLRIHSYARSSSTRGLLDFLRFLSFGLLSPHLIYSAARPASSQHLSWPGELARLLVAGAVLPISWWAGRFLISAYGRNSWLLNQLILAAAFTVIMTAFGQCITAFWKFTGSSNKVLIDKIFMARTPADFWRRWSWPMHLWLYRHVYIPAGGKRHPIRATMMAFLISGLFHEFIAGLVIGRVTGHQTLFFLVSGAGVLASPSMEKLCRRGRVPRLLMHLLTLVYLIASSSLMFATVNYIVPVYYKHIWLMW